MKYNYSLVAHIYKNRLATRRLPGTSCNPIFPTQSEEQSTGQVLGRLESPAARRSLLLLAGFAAGVNWNIANAAGILAIRYLGYALAYPIMQSGLFVGGLWGLYVFDEMKDRKARRIYWLSGLVLVAGVTCLALAR